MRGKVKWFSQEKGYGFITDERSRDHYFSVQDVQGVDLPGGGDQVDFQSRETSRGQRGSDVHVVSRSSEARRGDDRVTCDHCGRRMVPRIISYQGQVERSVCPFCAETYCSFSTPGWLWVVCAIVVLVVVVGC